MKGSDRIISYLKSRGFVISNVAEKLGVSRNTLYYQLANIDKNKPVNSDLWGGLNKLMGTSISNGPPYDLSEIIPWSEQEEILEKHRQRLANFDENHPVRKLNERNAKYIGPARSDEDGDTKFTEISPGWWGMMVELVPEYAKAGYLASYADPEFIEDLPKHYFTVDKFVRGKYRAFEITGDSMNDGSIDTAIPDGAIVLARELKRDAWRSKLHNHKWPNWVFVHRYEGIICKQIAHQDIDNGVLTLRSINPDKDTYPDITVKMDELEQIYNVILRQLR